MPDTVKAGQSIFYLDREQQTIERGRVRTVSYDYGVLKSIGVEFENKDFDEFSGDALNRSLFVSRALAETILMAGPEASISDIVGVDNGTAIQKMSFEELAKFLCIQDWRLGQEKECEEWLRQKTELWNA